MKQDLFYTAKNRTLYLTTLALLTALCFASRIWLIFLPNFKPITVIFVLVAMIFGPVSGMLLATLTILLSNFILGTGYWTLFQILGFWCVILACYRLLSADHLKKELSIHAIILGIMAFPYGLVQSIGDILILRPPNPFVYVLGSLLFDGYHALGNVTFYLILTPILYPLLIRVKHKILNQ